MLLKSIYGDLLEQPELTKQFSDGQKSKEKDPGFKNMTVSKACKESP